MVSFLIAWMCTVFLINAILYVDKILFFTAHLYVINDYLSYFFFVIYLTVNIGLSIIILCIFLAYLYISWLIYKVVLI